MSTLCETWRNNRRCPCPWQACCMIACLRALPKGVVTWTGQRSRSMCWKMRASGSLLKIEQLDSRGGHMPAPVSLRRVLKFRSIVSTSTGLAYAAVSLLGCIQLAYYLAGDSGWVAILLAGLLALLAAFCF